MSACGWILLSRAGIFGGILMGVFLTSTGFDLEVFPFNAPMHSLNFAVTLSTSCAVKWQSSSTAVIFLRWPSFRNNTRVCSLLAFSACLTSRFVMQEFFSLPVVIARATPWIIWYSFLNNWVAYSPAPEPLKILLCSSEGRKTKPSAPLLSETTLNVSVTSQEERILTKTFSSNQTLSLPGWWPILWTFFS